MRGRVLGSLSLLALLLAGAASAAEQMPPVLARDPVMLDGESMLLFGGGGLPTAVLSDKTPITGFAFGPGRLEVAYCGVTGRENRWGLWVVGAGPSDQEREHLKGVPLTAGPFSADPRQYRTPSSPPRLLWTAPEGATLRGPVWWSPNGAQLAVRVLTGEQCELIAVDYVTGETVQLARGGITAAAWSPDGKQLAYAQESGGKPEVWRQSFPPGERRKLGEGGLDLRWSADGTTLSWIFAQPGDTWTRQTWSAEADRLEDATPVPARPEGALWSPDGRLCAAAEGAEDRRQLLLYQSGSPRGEAVEVDGLHPQRVLGWSPDSRLVVVLAPRNVPVAIAAIPESGLRAGVRRVFAKESAIYRNIRASVIGPPLDPEAGPPAWSANMDMVSYVYDLREAGARAFLKWKMPQVEDEDLEQFLADRHAGPVPDAKQALLAISLLHEALPRDIEERSEEAAYRVKVLSNVKNIATALNIYLSDFDAFPVALTGEDLREILRDYLKTDSVFCLPDSDEVVVQYLIPPGTRPVSEDIPDPGVTPMVVVEGVRGWDLVGFVDGHAQAYPKEAADAWRKYLLPPKE